MNYTALARKWRPQKFNDVIGQNHIILSLTNSLRSRKIHHAYLFSGSHGIGKTTIARLFAKGLNCKTGITEFPCNQCISCEEIKHNNSLDLIEIDAASRTKVEDTRILLENIQYSPIHSRFKIYLIDEVHMLSKSSFNALLKTLEEPPTHVKFLLATTDPKKLPKTVLSRCIQFYLKLIESEKIQRRIEYILQSEKIESNHEPCKMIADLSQGSMRDALSLLDQALAIGNGKILTKSIKEMLELLDEEDALKIIQAVVQKDGIKILKLIEKISQKGIDLEKILIEMLSLIHKIILIQTLSSKKNDFIHLKFKKELCHLSNLIQPIELHFYYQTLLIGRKELKYSPSKRIGVEITLLRILFFQKHLFKDFLNYKIIKI